MTKNHLPNLRGAKMETPSKPMSKTLTKSLILCTLSILLITFSLSNPKIFYYLAMFVPVMVYLFHSLSSLHAKNAQNTPPGPLAVPVFGNWLQVGNDLNHRRLAALAKTYGPVFLLKLGVRDLVVVSTPELACEVLHAQGVEFGSRPRNVVFDIFTGGGQDMVFTVYGDHWRKMRRIMTLPFFTNKVVSNYSPMWEEEMDKVVSDLKHNEVISPRAKNEGVVIRKRLQLMLYNIMYRMMFDEGFESMEDPMFIEATKFNSERSRLAQSFEYNYGDFIPFLRPFLRNYLSKCRDLQKRRLAFFNNHYVQKRRYVLINCIIRNIIYIYALPLI